MTRRARKHRWLVMYEKIHKQAKRTVQKWSIAPAKRWAGGSHEKAINYLLQSQQCDLAAGLTEEMNKYPKSSPERALFKVARFGEAYGRPGTINIHTDYSPEEMMSRFKTVFEKKEEQ